MRKFNGVLLFVCGLFLTLAAFPVFAQENQVREVPLNQKPFLDLAELIREKVDGNKVDLTKPFLVELEGTLDNRGMLDRKTAKFVKTEGDAKTADIAKSFIEAVNDSGVFGYLQRHGIEKIKLTVAQNESQIYAVIVSEQKTPEKVKTLVTLWNSVLTAIHLLDEQGLKNLSSDERTLLSGAKVNSKNNSIILNFAYQKSVIREVINRKLEENDNE